MLGLIVSAGVADEVAVLLDENKLSLNGKRAAAIRDRFDRALFPLKDDVDAVLTRMLLADIDGAEPLLVEGDLVSKTIKAAERKRPAYSRTTAITARKRFDEIFGNVIMRARRRGAHKGWVTRLEWNEAERLGLWTHRWTLRYVFDGHAYTMDGEAVHEDRAWREIARVVKKLARTHRGARISSTIIARLSGRGRDDVTKRAQKAFARAVL